MKRLSFFTLLFAAVFATFAIAPAFLPKPFEAYSLMKVADVLDVFTPLVLIPLYWVLYQVEDRCVPGLKENMFFLLFVAFWVEGHGMHLAANSIGHYLTSMTGSDVFKLAFFYDEVLSHYLWHTGVAGLSALIIVRQWRNPFFEERSFVGVTALAGVLYGISYFLITIEGATIWLGVPFAVLAALAVAIWGRKDLAQRPLMLFFLIAYLTATVLFAGWGIYWGGLPEFSQVGIID
ncbi:MAG: hypothetical protein PHR56_07840 [Dehalococcoidales bacterium]|nr:hypothetical protein [Dehalococcoidales bacterium]